MVAQGLSLDTHRLGSHPAQSAGGGTLLIVTCALHGNEPAGVNAARRVLADLERRALPLRGRVVALAGNLQALAAHERFLVRDLNRIWTPEAIAAARTGEAHDPEALALAGLAAELDELLAEAHAQRRRVVLLDLHSTSADGPPFAIMADSLQNRRLGRALGIPVLLGLEERLDGTLLSHFSRRGHASLCIEGGQSELASTVDHHESAIWLCMAASGMLPAGAVERLEDDRQRLAESAWGLPNFIEVVHREPVPADRPYRTEPGYTNFHAVQLGETLGWVELEGSERAVRTPLDGLLLMPRYQGRGEDAFFVGRQVRRRWLLLSETARRLPLHGFLRLWPGLRVVPGERDQLLLEASLARPLVREVLRLFGYRKRTRVDGRLLFVRRRALP